MPSNRQQAAFPQLPSQLPTPAHTHPRDARQCGVQRLNLRIRHVGHRLLRVQARRVQHLIRHPVAHTRTERLRGAGWWELDTGWWELGAGCGCVNVPRAPGLSRT